MFEVGETVWCIPLHLKCHINAKKPGDFGMFYECFFVDKGGSFRVFSFREDFLAKREEASVVTFAGDDPAS